MIRIAVVEDERESLDTVLNCLKRFEEEEGIGFVTTVFCDGLDFISGYRPLYDIVFMDIEMPMLNGMSTAKKLRKVDSSVALVFITRLRQYALLGYEVDAVGYLLKPLEYASFRRQIEKSGRKRNHISSCGCYCHGGVQLPGRVQRGEKLRVAYGGREGRVELERIH